MRDILLLIITGSISLTALGRPLVGLFGFIAYSIVAPHSQVWGIARTIPHAELIIICTLVGYFLSGEPKKFPLGRETILLFGLWCTFAISTIFALSPKDALEKFEYVSKILFVVFVSTAMINDEHRFRMLLLTIALSLGLYGLKGGLFVLRTGGNSQVFGPDQSFLTANNAIGLALAMNVPFLYYFIKACTRRWLSWLMKAMLVLSYPAIVCTFSRGAWLGLAAGTTLLALKSRQKLLTLVMLGLLGLTSPIWYSVVVSDRMANRYETLVNYEQDESAESRLWSWEFCKRVGLSRPLTGGGFEFYTPTTYQEYFPEFVEYWSHKLAHVLYWSCHSMWLTVLGEHGVVAFLLWIALFICCFLSFRRMRSDAVRYAALSWLTPYADMLQVGFIVYMISGTFLDVAYFDVFFQLVGAVISANEISKRIKLKQAVADRPVTNVAFARAL